MKFLTIASVAAMGLTAAPVFAQDVQLCGPALPAGPWAGGSAELSDISTAGGAFNQIGVVPPGGNFVTQFSVSTSGLVRLEAAGQNGADTVIDLYDSAGQLVVTDDDSGGGWDSRAEVSLAPGQYCLATRSYYGEMITADIRIGQASHPALTLGSGGSNILACTAETLATPLGGGPIDRLPGSEAEATNTISGTPYYRFSIGEQTPITIRATNPSADPYIYIYDANGALIAENDDYNSLNSRIDFTEGLAAGTYCIGMRALTNPNLPVTVSVSSFDQGDMMRDLFASGEASPPADGSSYPVTPLGTLEAQLLRDTSVGGDAVWHSFEVPESGLVLIDAIGVGNSDPMISLFDALGRPLGFNDDANGSLDSQLTARVNPGTYMLGVMQYHGQPGAIRIALERFIPAR